MDQEDKPKTAFATGRGLFQFNVMPFGLCYAPATFKRRMESVLACLNWDICLVFLDDIIVTGMTFEEMLSKLRKVLDRLKGAGLKLKAKRCCLVAKKVTYLGHVVSAEGVATDPAKTAAVEHWPVPTNVTEVRSFLGLCSYYRRFIKDFSSIPKCFHTFTEKGADFKWTSDCQSAFDTLKLRLTNAPILGHPDFNHPFILDTDASNVSKGAVLSQNIDGTERVVAYASRTLTKCERRY